MHEYLIKLKNIHEFYQFFLSNVLGQNVLIPPDQNVSHGGKCPNTPNWYTMHPVRDKFYWISFSNSHASGHHLQSIKNQCSMFHLE